MKRTLSELQAVIEYLPKDSEHSLRSKYIEAFVDTSCEWYKDRIATTREFSDGVCYTGYLWECLINPTYISLFDVVSYRDRLGEVLVFWDIHSSQRIFVKDYWKFGKDTMLRLEFGTLVDNLEFFPEDIYIFDDSISWSLVLTHEDDHDGMQIYAKVGDI